jgi:hypothetical protein
LLQGYNVKSDCTYKCQRTLQLFSHAYHLAEWTEENLFQVAYLLWFTAVINKSNQILLTYVPSH